MSKFQIALLVIFGFFIFLAVLVFSLYRGASSSQGSVTIWGSIEAPLFNTWLNEAGLNQNASLLINYRPFPEEALEEEFTEALAKGVGPDLIIIRESDFWQSRGKLVPIPYESLSLRDFKEAFAEGGEIFLTPEGIYALPLYTDPLVLYYNRDLLSAAGIAKPLGFWDEIYNQANKLTKRDPAGNLIQSVISLGEWRNIPNYKEVLSLLMLQAGTPITGFVNNRFEVLLDDNLTSSPIMPAEAALNFFTQFSNPAKSFYSWNRTLPDAQTHFAIGDASYYLGFAGELESLKRKSPTLNFGVTRVPQSRTSEKVTTFGKIYGLALSRGTRSSALALEIARTLVGKNNAAKFSQVSGLPTLRRDLLSDRSEDPALSVFQEAALQARSWVDPNPSATKEIVAEMIDNVTSGRLRTSEAINNAAREFESLTKD